MNERLAALLLFSLAALEAAAATEVHRVSLRVLPTQPVSAITIRSGESVLSVPVREGQALVPADLATPWSLQLIRFEGDAYSAADLDAKKPWTIRELGILNGRLERRTVAGEPPYTCLLAQAASEDVREAEFRPARDGAFSIRVPAGIYHGAFVGSGYGSRIRSGIVVEPGKATDLGAVALETANPVVIRVLDSGARVGVVGARVIWDPPEQMLNAALIRRLYGRRWSSVTDRRGLAEIQAVGPVPHSARWRIEAEGFAKARTASVLLQEPGRFVMPDVGLRPHPTILVRVRFPVGGADERKELKGGDLVAGEQRDPNTRKFTPVDRTPLREGEASFRFDSYGRKRLWVENGSGRMLVFENIEVKEPRTVIDLALRPVEISGRVTRNGDPVVGTLVSLADPQNGSTILAQSPSDESGGFRLRTWATGTMRLYTIPARQPEGKRIGSASAKVDLTARSHVLVDLEMPNSGFSLSIVDAQSGAPVKARLDLRSRSSDGNGRMSSEETDTEGKFDLVGFPEGTAKVTVTAKGYRVATHDLEVREDGPGLTVRLERAAPSSLRVIDPRGLPIANAIVVGGFDDELDPQPLYDSATDAEGRVHYDSPPAAGTVFYVAAAGHALGMTTLATEGDVTVVLQPPTSSIVTLRQNNRPPDKVFLVMAAPAGRSMIPLTALGELAGANGMSLYQLAGSSPTGDVVLPEFLPAGSWDLYLARRGERTFKYEKVGSVRTPLTRNVVIASGP